MKVPSTFPDQPPAPARAAAIAELLFSLLMLVSIGIIRVAAPEVSGNQSTVNTHFGHAISLALYLVPFAVTSKYKITGF